MPAGIVQYSVLNISLFSIRFGTMFPKLYSITGLLLLLTQLAILGMLAYTQVLFGKVPYFGNADDQPPGYEKYFSLLRVLLFATFFLILIWALCTPFAVLWNRRSRVEEEKTELVKGGIGFILAVFLLLVDPFGIFKYITTA